MIVQWFFQSIQKASSETAFDGDKMQLIFIRIKMFLVCQFLTIKHCRAKIQVLKIYQVKFQGRTRNASLRRNRKSEQYQRAKWRWIYNRHLTLQLQSLALKYQTKFTFDNFKFKHRRAKIQVLTIYQVKFQGLTQYASYETSQLTL